MAGSMGGDVGAGASARREAQRWRQRAAQAERNAERWEKGEAGERETAHALAQLTPEFLVAHDIPIEGSAANIDHLVIGPTGVFVIDSKNLDDRFEITKGRDTLWRGRFPLRREIETLRWESAKAAELLGVEPTSVLCFVRNNLARQEVVADNVIAVNLRDLVVLLGTHRVGHGGLEMTRLQRTLGGYLAEVSGPPAAAADPIARRVATAPAPHVERIGKTRARPRSPRKTPLRRNVWRSLGTWVIQGAMLALVVVAVFVFAPRVLRWMSESLGKASTVETEQDSPPTTPSPTGELAQNERGTFHCLARDAGWTLRLRWPPEAAGTTEVHWSSRPTGTALWSEPRVWSVSDDAPVLVGLSAGGSVEVEVTTGTSVLTSAMFTAPPTSC